MIHHHHHHHHLASRKRIMTLDNGDMAPWSDLNHDVLFLVMVQLGVVDFFAFSRVCKSWRSFALSNLKTFMVSKPPMRIYHSDEVNEDDWCYLKDFEEKRFKTIIPHFAGRIHVGLTCGYLILFSIETCDFWLVNPITKRELHFPDFPFYIHRPDKVVIKAILVFSPSKSGWVFVVLHRKISFYEAGKSILSFYIMGERGWNHVSSTIPIVDLHFFKGKIYTLHNDCSLGELRLNLMRKCKWTLHETNNFLNPPNLNLPLLVSSVENFYVIDGYPNPQKVMELDTGEMKWVLPEMTIIEKYAFFVSFWNLSTAIKPESWLGPRTKYKSCEYFVDSDKSEQRMFVYGGTWYFLHDCLNVNFLDE